MDLKAVREGLKIWMPIDWRTADLRRGKIGLVLVDPVVGFTLKGALSDPVSLQPMVQAIDALCKDLLESLGARLSIYIFRDHHGPDQIEEPYPPHCQEGSGEEELDPQLQWLECHTQVTVRDKDCINGMIGSLDPVGLHTYKSHFAEWIHDHAIDRLMVVGDCTDICDLDFVVSVLSARNHGMFGARRSMPVYVYEPACGTYHLPDPESLGLPLSARHDGVLTHHAALYFMQARGALICHDYEA